MKKLILSCAALLALIGAYTASYYVTTRDEIKYDNKADKDASQPAFVLYDELTVRQYDGKVALFKDGDTDPAIILDVYVFTLPQHERLALEEGYKITEGDIDNLIQNYTS